MHLDFSWEITVYLSFRFLFMFDLNRSDLCDGRWLFRCFELLFPSSHFCFVLWVRRHFIKWRRWLWKRNENQFSLKFWITSLALSLALWISPLFVRRVGNLEYILDFSITPIFFSLKLNPLSKKFIFQQLIFLFRVKMLGVERSLVSIKEFRIKTLGWLSCSISGLTQLSSDGVSLLGCCWAPGCSGNWTGSFE